MSIVNLKNCKILLVISIAFLVALTLMTILPLANAVYTDTSPRKTTAYISVAPPVIGKDQQLTVNLWVWPSPSGSTYYAQTLSDIYYENFAVTFTRPDGSKDTFMPINPSMALHGDPTPGKTEAVGTTYFFYKPNQVGTWSVSFSFPGKTFFTPFGTPGSVYEPATSRTITFEVQEDPVNAGTVNGWPWAPLPTGYWQSPVNDNNREWSAIAGPWMQSGHDTSGTNFNPYSTGPATAHVAWKEPFSIGGIIGGDWGSYSFDAGYRGPNVVIMAGRIFYNDNAGGTFSARDLRTGELLYRVLGSITLGQVLRPESVSPDTPQVNEARNVDQLWGFSSSNWIRYDPFTGAVLQTITGAPTDVRDRAFVDGSSEVYISQAGNWNTSARPNGYAYSNLIKWDYSLVTGNSWKTGIVWNVSTIRPDGTSVGDGRRNLFQVVRFDAAGVVIAKAHNDESHYQAFDMATGAWLYTKQTGIIDKRSLSISSAGPYAVYDSARMTYTAFDVKTGNKLWESDPFGNYGWGAAARNTAVAYDTIYAGTFDGHIYAIDAKTGKLKWQSESLGDSTETVWLTSSGVSTMVVADGKVYWSFIYPWEVQPRSRFREIIAQDAYTGKTLWRLSGSMNLPSLAEGYLIATNVYDGFMYSFGKGKTETAVSIQNDVIAAGSGALIRGTVMDLSPAQPGTPAVAKESMSEWMDYLHMQNATLINNPPSPKGVPVQLFAIDPNGNVVDVGTVTTDSLGHFELLWTPSTIGTYKVLASFAGDDSYWSSSAETALAVTAAPQANGGTEQPAVAADNTAVIIGSAVAVIIAVAVVGLLLFKKKP